jgi:cytochrome c biogenesis protein ResB
VRSASPRIARALALACCLALLGGGVSGCMTTQETAALRQARAKRVLKARALRREHRADRHRQGRSEKDDR